MARIKGRKGAAHISKRINSLAILFKFHFMLSVLARMEVMTMRQVLLSFLSKYFLKDIASLVGEV